MRLKIDAAEQGFYIDQCLILTIMLICGSAAKLMNFTKALSNMFSSQHPIMIGSFLNPPMLRWTLVLQDRDTIWRFVFWLEW
jgi:hypothetical protein